VEDAFAALQNQAVLAPDNPRLFLSMGNILMTTMRPQSAVQAFEKCVALSPNDPRAKFGLANALSTIGDTARAEELVMKLLTDTPDHPGLLYSLGIIRRRQGLSDEAAALFEKAIESGPAPAQAYFDLIATTGQPFSDGKLIQLQSLSQKENLPLAASVHAHFALARHFDLGGEFGDAANNLRAANDARKAHLANIGHRFSGDDHRRRIDSIIDAFNPELLANPVGAGSDSGRPVFVIGMPRSGTTLIERIIANHKSGAGAGELTDFEKVAAGKDPRSLKDLSQPQLKEIAGAYLEPLGEVGGTVLRVVDKYPANFMHLGFIRILFPNAYIIHCRRDVRDVGLSCYFQNFSGPLPWSSDLADIGHYISGYQRLMSHWREYLPDPFLELEYESLVADPEPRIKELIQFIGLEWDPACLDFHSGGGEVNTASAVQVREPINARSLHRWKNYEDLLAPMIAAID
ncbi:MAG: sulfotransferase, partial [Rhodospirillales bacterium]|nr:sulfotransferase [Rhodospirillales bacterium]